MSAVTADGEKPLIDGMPVWNVYLAALTGDRLPELCATVSFGSGIVDTRVIVCDYADGGRLYELSDRMRYDYALSLENGRLTVTQSAYNGEKLAAGDLAIINGVLVSPGGAGGTGEYEPYITQQAAAWEPIGYADLNRDGRKETIYIDKSQMDTDLFVTLRVFDDGGEIWSEQLATSHAGWDSLFLYELDGEYSLLRYNPGMWQGYCIYGYVLFTPEGGYEKVLRSNTIEFDINGTKELDAPGMAAFAQEVNALLSRSVLLASSEGGNYSFGPSAADPFFERYSWLDGFPELYEEAAPGRRGFSGDAPEQIRAPV